MCLPCKASLLFGGYIHTLPYIVFIFCCSWNISEGKWVLLWIMVRSPLLTFFFSNENLQWPWQTLFIRCQEGCTGVVSAGSCISSCFFSPGDQNKTPPWLIRCFLNFSLTCTSSSVPQFFQLMNLWPLATVLMSLIVSGRTISQLLLCKGCRETCQEQPVTFNHCLNSPDRN